EFMGVIEEAGSGVKDLNKGDRVVIPFPIACGRCFFCQDDLPGHCENSNPEKYGPEGGLLDQKGGGLFGYTDLYGGYSGGQAEYVRVPYANFGPRKVPQNFSDEEVLFLTDIFPTGYTSIDWAGVKGGDAVGMEAERKPKDKLANIWHVEVGSIKALKAAISAVRRGGWISVLGVYGVPYDKFPLGQIFDKGIHLSFGQAPVQKYIDDLIGYLEEGKIKLDDVISHRLPLAEAPRGYEIFNEKKEDCVKVVLKP